LSQIVPSFKNVFILPFTFENIYHFLIKVYLIFGFERTKINVDVEEQLAESVYRKYIRDYFEISSNRI